MTAERTTAFAVFTEIGIIHQLATRVFERVLPDRLAISQFSVLDHLLRLGGDWSPARLANAFQVTRPTMTNTLQRLAALGAVTIAANPGDGRAKRVSITPAGIALRDRALTALAPALDDLAQSVPAETFDGLLPGLARLRAELDAAR